MSDQTYTTQPASEPNTVRTLQPIMCIPPTHLLPYALGLRLLSSDGIEPSADIGAFIQGLAGATEAQIAVAATAPTAPDQATIAKLGPALSSEELQKRQEELNKGN